MTATTADPIVVSAITPTPLRWGLALSGGIVVFVATSELWRGVWPISIVTPFFGLLLGTALAAGGLLLVGALFGPDETWSIEPGHLTVQQSLRRFHGRRQYGPANIASVTLAVSDWDDGPPGYRIAVDLATGRRLRSPVFASEARARAAMAVLTASD